MALGDRGLEAPIKLGDLQSPMATMEITAFATGGQASATVISTSWNVITVCASGGDSVKLPANFRVNTIIYIKNDGAASCDVFPGAGDDLGAGANTAIALPAGESVAYIATVENTTWTVSIVHPVVAEVNDLTAAVVWANVPDANITVGSVTQHETSLTILESQITDGTLLARLAADEVVTGKYGFKNAGGIEVLDAAGTDKIAILHDGANVLANYTNTSRHYWRDGVAHRWYDPTNATYYQRSVSTTGVLFEKSVGIIDYFFEDGDGNLYFTMNYDGIDGSGFTIHRGNDLELQGTTGANKVTLRHDNTDLVLVGTNTTDFNITGISGFNVVNYSFDVDQTVGAGQDNYVLTYDNVSGEISLEVGGAEVNDLSAAVTWANVPQANIPDPLLMANGSAGAPSYSFANSSTSGWYRKGTNEIAMSIAGVAKWQFRGQNFEGLVGNSPLLIAIAATATAPTFAPHAGATTSGIGAAQAGDVTIISAAIEGSTWSNFNGGITQQHACDEAVSAFAGGGIGSATVLKQSYNIVTTVASAGDSVRLPSLYAKNTIVYIKNDSSNSLDVFPNNASDNLGQGNGTAEALGAGESVAYIATAISSTWTPFVRNSTFAETNDLSAAVTWANVPQANIPAPMLPGDGAVGAPAYSFASAATTGMYMSGSLRIAFGGSDFVTMDGADFRVSGDIECVGSTAGALKNETTSATNPTVLVNRGDVDSGIGQGSLDALDLIAGALSCISIAEVGGARKIGFYVTAPIVLQTGVAVTEAGIHAALVNLGLITA